MTTTGPFETLIPLGTNGFHASLGRETMTFMVLGPSNTDGPRAALLLDAGSGVARLGDAALQAQLCTIDRLDIVLTHYHWDHTSGLCAVHSALRAAERGIELHLWAPGQPLVDADPIEAIESLVSPPLFPIGLEGFRQWMGVNPYTSVDGLKKIPLLSDVDVRLRRQTHAGGSVGLRLGDQLAYITDTTADPETVALIDGVDLLIQDVWVSAADAARNPALVSGHPDAASARQIAERARVQRLLPVHHHPHNTSEMLSELHAELASPLFEIVEVAEGSSVLLR